MIFLGVLVLYIGIYDVAVQFASDFDALFDRDSKEDEETEADAEEAVALNETYYVIEKNVVVYADTDFLESVGILGYNQSVNAISYDEMSDAYRISYGEEEGYVHASALSGNVDVQTNDGSTFLLDADAIYQMPELPTGCEVTSLAIALNYRGFAIDKVTLADEYLETADIGSTTPYFAFIGDPTTTSAYGCYAPVIVEAANEYLTEIGSTLVAHDVSHSDFSDFVSYLREGTPVILWAIHRMDTSYYHLYRNDATYHFNVINGEHCGCLIGYTADSYIIADPQYGIVYYDKDDVEECYGLVLEQAVVIN